MEVQLFQPSPKELQMKDNFVVKCIGATISIVIIGGLAITAISLISINKIIKMYSEVK